MQTIAEIVAAARRAGCSYGEYVFQHDLSRSAPTLGQRVCPHCDRAFNPLRPEQVYCSLRCRVHAELDIP